MLKNKYIDFDEEKHQYKKDGKMFTSVTTFIGRFFDKFDSQKISKILAQKNDVTPEYYLQQWKMTADEGTIIHKQIENSIQGKPLEVNNKKISGALKVLEEYKAHKIMSEVRIYSEQYLLAGTIDCIVFLNDTDVILLDWKTNKRITTSGFDDKMGTHRLTKHLPDCHISHYSLQLQIYQYILETEYNLNVKDMVLVHLISDTENVRYHIDKDDKLIQELVRVNLLNSFVEHFSNFSR